MNIIKRSLHQAIRTRLTYLGGSNQVIHPLYGSNRLDQLTTYYPHQLVCLERNRYGIQQGATEAIVYSRATELCKVYLSDGSHIICSQEQTFMDLFYCFRCPAQLMRERIPIRLHPYGHGSKMIYVDSVGETFCEQGYQLKPLDSWIKGRLLGLVVHTDKHAFISGFPNYCKSNARKPRADIEDPFLL